MVRVGVHVSIAGSPDKAIDRAEERGCDCFQIFTKNPRGWAAKEITDDIASDFIHKLRNSPLTPAIAHMPYLPNLASENPDIFKKSVDALKDELVRCSRLQIPLLVTHLGHAKDDLKSGRLRVIDAAIQALDQDPGCTRLLLENTAGEKNSVGSKLEDISQVLDGIGRHPRIGVCFDTCHAFAAGYDLRTRNVVYSLIDQIVDLIGVHSVNLIHLNDTKGDIGSGLDRHEHIGLGRIGEEGLQTFLTNPLLQNIPVICETPVDERRGDKENICVVRRLTENFSDLL
jgi:deoxyribonuclease-4